MIWPHTIERLFYKGKDANKHQSLTHLNESEKIMRLKQLPTYLIFLTLFTLLIVACEPAPENNGDTINAIGFADPSIIESEQLSTQADLTSPQLSGAVDVDTVSESGGETAVSSSSTQTNLPTNSDIETDARGIQVGFTEDGHPYRGNPNAPVVIEEFSDFQCPFCSRFFNETLPAIEEEHIVNGTAVFIYYDFPLTNIHPQAMPAANATRCAGEQSIVAYWAMHDFLFVDPDAWSNDNFAAVFIEAGINLGLDMDSFTSCLESDKYFPQIQEDLNLGVSRGVRSTPSFFINDQPLIGAQPLSTFMSAIETISDGGEIAAAPQAAPPQSAPPSVPQPAPTPASIPLESYAAVMGDPNAPVTIIEYTDYQCPFCKRHTAETMPRIINELVDTGQVYYVLKDFPLDEIHPDARSAANAARCAGEQDAYWEMHDAIFTEQEEWAGLGAAADDYFVQLGGSLGLDEGELEECVVNGRYDAAVQANYEEGVALGISGTPNFFIDGYPVVGARDFELFEYAVELAKAGTLADAYVQQQPQQQEAPPPTRGVVEVPLGDAIAIGDPNAPVIIVEYTDFQCPFCARNFAQTFPRIKENYVDTGVVYYVFKDFPLSIHPQAEPAAEAARCANAQEAYLPMHDLLFGRQAEWQNRDDAVDIFIGYASELGLDNNVFTQCMNNHTYLEAIRADFAEGTQLGVNGTPAFFLNGYFVSGAQPYDLFEQAITQLAAEGN